jgi:hypothetical protein
MFCQTIKKNSRFMSFVFEKLYYDAFAQIAHSMTCRNRHEAGDSMFVLSAAVGQHSETNVMHFSFSVLRIKGLYMFRALPAHPQEVVHNRHLVYCLRVLVMSIVFNLPSSEQQGSPGGFQGAASAIPF